MASIVVGSVAVDVVPNAMNFARDLRGQIEGPVDAVGQEVGQNLSDAVIDHLADAIPEGLAAGIPESAEAGDSAGAKFGDAFSTQIRAKIDAALKSLPDANVGLDDTEAMGKLAELREQLIELGYNELDVSLTDEEALAKLRELRDELAMVALESPDIRVRIDAQKAQIELDQLLAKFAALEAMSFAIHPDDALSNIGAEAEQATRSVGGTTTSLSGLGYALGAVALIATPVLGVLIAGAGTAALGIANATVQTGDLKSAWKDLEAEAGRAIQPGLQAAVDGLSRAIPQLDPLIDTLGADIGHVLDQAATWLGNGGATEIVDYLKEEIPIVGGMFESLGSALAGFVEVTQGPANILMNTFKEMADAATAVEQILQGKMPDFGKATASDIGPGKSSSNGLVSGANGTVGFGLVKDVYNWATSGSQPGTALSSGQLGPGQADYGTATQRPVPSAVLQHGFGQDSAGPSLDSQSLQQAASGLDANTVAATANATAFNETVSAYQTAQAAAVQFKAQTEATTEAMAAENDAAGLIQQALSALGGNVLGVAQADTQFHTSITTLNTSLAKNGQTLDINTDAGQKNRAAIEASVAAAQQHAEAIAQQTGSTEQATAAYNQDIQTLKDQLAATGMSKDAIDKYVDSIDAIPPLKRTQLDIDAANATAVMLNFQNQFKHLTVVVSESILRSDAAGYSANGNMYKAFADGGFENHVAQIAAPGIRVWAEPETGGESYIPHAASKRQRSEAILSETANLFGGQYIPRGAKNYMDGMVLRGSGGSAGSGGAGAHEHPINVLLDGKKITKAVNEQNGWNGRL